jgi:hypothetical protein
MCIRVQFAPRHEITDPWDRARNVIVLNDELAQTSLFTMRALRAILVKLGVPQPSFGALCWCGEPISLLPAIPQQRRSNEVIHHHAPIEARRHAS